MKVLEKGKAQEDAESKRLIDLTGTCQLLPTAHVDDKFCSSRGTCFY